MRLLTTLCLVLLGFLSVSQALVHTVTTVNHKLDPGSPAYSRYHKRHEEQLKKKIGLQAYRSRSQAIITAKNVYYNALANISVGTPAQNFIVEMDFFNSGSFILIDSNANLSSVSDDIPAKNTFNSSQSSTLTDLNLNFTSWYGNGFVANDILALGDTLKSKVDFGLLDSVGSFLSYYSFDGLLGLAPPSSYLYSDNLTTILSQLAGFLDEPVITIWTNNSADGNGSSVGTLGAVDTEHCQSNWIYVPQDSNKYYPYSFHVSSVELTLNGTKQQLGLNKTMVVDQYVDSMYLPASLKPWFVNATNAIYDSNSGYYKVDCDVSKAAKLVFNIGGKGNTTSSANKQLVISAADYVAYSESSDICYLATYFSKHLSVLEMNIQFSNNHCIAYNIKDNTIGIADSKTPITDVKQLNK